MVGPRSTYHINISAVSGRAVSSCTDTVYSGRVAAAAAAAAAAVALSAPACSALRCSISRIIIIMSSTAAVPAARTGDGTAAATAAAVAE